MPQLLHEKETQENIYLMACLKRTLSKITAEPGEIGNQVLCSDIYSDTA